VIDSAHMQLCGSSYERSTESKMQVGSLTFPANSSICNMSAEFEYLLNGSMRQANCSGVAGTRACLVSTRKSDLDTKHVCPSRITVTRSLVTNFDESSLGVKF